MQRRGTAGIPLSRAVAESLNFGATKTSGDLHLEGLDPLGFFSLLSWVKELYLFLRIQNCVQCYFSNTVTAVSPLPPQLPGGGCQGDPRASPGPRSPFQVWFHGFGDVWQKSVCVPQKRRVTTEKSSHKHKRHQPGKWTPEPASCSGPWPHRPFPGTLLT